MSPYLKFNIDHDALLPGEPPAILAIPAIPEDPSSKNSASSNVTPPIARCPTPEGEEQSNHGPERSNTQHSDERAASLAMPAIPEDQSSKNSKNSNPEPLTQDYPCVVCGRIARWNDRGIWRCVACWPLKEPW